MENITSSFGNISENNNTENAYVNAEIKRWIVYYAVRCVQAIIGIVANVVTVTGKRSV